jgi:hypothetical protein
MSDAAGQSSREMLLIDFNKPVGPITGKWCVRKFHSLWAVYDEWGVWWGMFETHDEALAYVVYPVERLERWLHRQ